jgi:hypothetical protein
MFDYLCRDPGHLASQEVAFGRFAIAGSRQRGSCRGLRRRSRQHGLASQHSPLLQALWGLPRGVIFYHNVQLR